MTAPADFPIVVSQAGLLDGSGGDLLVQILAGLVVASLSFLFGFNRGRTYNINIDNSVHIYAAIQNISLAAMAANSDQLLARAKALREEITARLGPVLVLADGLNKPLKTLDTAIKGKTRDAPAGAVAGSGAACTPHVTVLQNSQIVVKGEDCGTCPPPCPPASTPPAPVDRDMTDAERVAALRSAIGAFHDHWSQKTLRLNELREARHALCHTAPVDQPAHH